MLFVFCRITELCFYTVVFDSSIDILYVFDNCYICIFDCLCTSCTSNRLSFECGNRTSIWLVLGHVAYSSTRNRGSNAAELCAAFVLLP